MRGLKYFALLVGNPSVISHKRVVYGATGVESNRKIQGAAHFTWANFQVAEKAKREAGNGVEIYIGRR